MKNKENIEESLKFLNTVLQNFSVIKENLTILVKNGIDIYSKFNIRNRQYHKLIDQGMIPHENFPWNDMLNLPDNNMFEICYEYIENNHTLFINNLLENIEKYDITEDTKETFKEVIYCFNNKMYRSIVPTLFTCIKSQIRFDFNVEHKNTLASLQNFQEFIRKIPVGILWKRSISHAIIDAMFRIIYTKAKENDILNFLKENNIPNRHTAVHGIFHYNKKIHALNIIIFADYVFNMIDISKEYLRSIEDNP